MSTQEALSIVSDGGLAVSVIDDTGSSEQPSTHEIHLFTWDHLWPDGVIPYRFDTEYARWSIGVQLVLKAFGIVEANTCIRFKPVNGEDKSCSVHCQQIPSTDRMS